MRQTLTSLLAIFCFTWSYAQQPGEEAGSSSTLVIPPAQKEAFQIYLLMGQSNMVGRDTHNIASQGTSPHVLALDEAGQWTVARDPLHHSEGRIPPGVGPGMSFAFEILKTKPNVTIGLVPCAVGGTPLRRWVKGGDLYEKAVNRAKIAAQSGVIAGVLWHQGETDATKEGNANSYEARLTQMFKDLRTDFGKPALPIVVGQLGGFLRPDKEPYAETVRTAIQQMPSVLLSVGYADSANLPDKGDKLHFSAEAQKEFGVRYAKSMLDLQKGN
ncbi:MAG: sialate O-acetylesterase [Chthoniobacteraceae bacterium]